MNDAERTIPYQPGGDEPTGVHEPAPALSGREPAEALTATGRKPGRWRPGLAVTAVVLALLSFVAGLRLLFSPKVGAPASWPEVISALQGGAPADGNGPARKNVEQQSRKTGTAPKPQPEPWPAETLAFAGKKAGGEWSANGLGMRFCWCPAGQFVMGSPRNEKDRGFNYSVEEQQRVTLTKGFWLAKYETTQGQWERVMGTTLIQQKDIAWSQGNWERHNPGATEWWDMNRLKWRPQRRARSASELDFGEGPNYPIYYVNHLEATDFCRKLTEQERKAGRLPPGWEFCLPTDAQWEYACRARTKTATAFGDRLSSRQANFDGDFPYNGADKGPTVGRMQSVGVYQPGRMQPVGSYQPNAWGLYDMHGNAWEWCRDWDGAPPGGTDPEIKFGDVNRLMRGGSWRCPGKLCRSANRMGHARWTTGDNETGFRVALVQLDPKPKPAPEPKTNPRPLPPGILVNSIGMKLAPIPAGRFLMGSPVDEDRRAWMGRDEIDYEEQHPVTIREPFYLGVYLVTQEEYRQIMGNVPGYKASYFSHEGEGKDKVKGFMDTRQFPRDTVGWEDAQEFCRRLSELPEEKKLGRRYRLPTEEEWEYACRAGTSTPYYFGKTISPQQANVDDKVGRTTPVGHYNNPNRFGLHDMHGNLLEYCEGSLAPYQEDLRDPGTVYPRVLRGGFWGQPGVGARCACRQAGGGANRYTGFRVAFSVGAGTP